MVNKIVCSFLFLVVHLFSFISTDNVPVLVWESKSIGEHFHTVPALSEFDRDGFLNHFLKKLKSYSSKPLIVAFVAPTLSLEDFSGQDFNKRPAFSGVQNLVENSNGIEFLPSVQSADEAIENLQSYGYKIKDLKDLKDNEQGVVSIVRLDDAKFGEDRPELLSRHDDFISETYKKLARSQDSFISLLTGQEPSWIEPEFSLSRIRRQLLEAEANGTVGGRLSEGYVFNASGKILLITKEAPLLTVDGETVVLPPKHEDTLDQRSTSQSLRLISTFLGGEKKIVLRFKFDLSGNYWSLKQIDYTLASKEGSLFPTAAIQAERGSSYLNVSPYEFYSENKNASLKFQNLKTQAWTSGTFDPPESKATFFTIPIWMGIFTIGMLALIMIWGLTMVLDIKTMDQFDDPKGKTITVNASE